MNVVDFGEFSKNRSEKHEIDWLRDVKRELQKNYRKMFDGNNPEFDYLWQMYVDIDGNLEDQGLPPIGLPEDMDYPFNYLYQLDHLTENYTQWHKREFKRYCEMMEDTIEKIDEYIRRYDEG